MRTRSAENGTPLSTDSGDPREWCALAARRLAEDRPGDALEAARRAVDHDPGAEHAAGWGYRLASLAFERLGRSAEAVAAAEEAVRLAPGSWAARLRLGAALRHVPGRWRESRAQAARAVRYAPQEPDPHVLAGDLALLRGEHRAAEGAYREALRLLDGHAGARVGLGLALLRWESPRDHHDPAWPVDPRETGRARRALESWTRQIRLLLAAALVAAAVTAFGTGLTTWAEIGGGAVLAAVVAITLRQARRVRLWPYVPGMLARDVWLAASVSVTPVALAAYVAAVATLPRAVSRSAAGDLDGAWAVLAGTVLLNGVAVFVLRVLAEAWRGRPVAALAQFAAAGGDRTARRAADVTLWLVAGRAWSVLAAVAVAARITGEPRWAAVAPVVLLAPAWAYGGTRRPRSPGSPGSLGRPGSPGSPGSPRGLRGPHGPRGPRLSGRVHGGDRWLVAAVVTLAAASAALGGSALLAVHGRGRADDLAWWCGAGALAAFAAVFAARSARAWWQGSPGPWRASLIMHDGRGDRLPGDAGPPVGLSGDVRRTFTHAREVVLSCAAPGGPRALAVGAVGAIGPGGELRLIAADDAWEAAERDPRVAVFAADPAERGFWVEVRGIAVGDPEAGVLRVTPEHVTVGEFPGRHRGRAHAG
ncbi:tetratricopeptide repeat protein [Streptosporangium sandarakinum]|uniref:tetratricopeptide repeat protein n=1 Tax=Streptosporangium sandarakinum TaxID=1260955 RepID=UPI003447636C